MRFYDADMEVNTAQNKIVTDDDGAQGAYDFESIVTHEAGHFLGLAHTPTRARDHVSRTTGPDRIR